jgi:hypothetical protein
MRAQVDTAPLEEFIQQPELPDSEPLGQTDGLAGRAFDGLAYTLRLADHC